MMHGVRITAAILFYSSKWKRKPFCPACYCFTRSLAVTFSSYYRVGSNWTQSWTQGQYVSKMLAAPSSRSGLRRGEASERA